MKFKTAVARDFLTGLTALVGLIGLVATLWVIGDLKDYTLRTYSFTLKLNTAGSLGETSRVALNGVKIGAVAKAQNEPNPADGVVLTLKINRGVKIPDNFTVYIDRAFVGESILQLDVPKPAPGAAVGWVEENSVHSRRASTLFDLIREPLNDPLAKLNSVAASIEKLSVTYDEVGKQAIDLMKPQTEADLKAGASPNFRTTLDKIEQAVGNANLWLGDSALRSDTKSLLAKADSATEKLGAAADAVTAAAKSAGAQVDAVGPKVADAAVQARDTLRRVAEAADQVNTLSAGMNKGEGSAGQFVKNPDLYNSLKDAADRLQRVLEELQLLIQKYKSEGIPINL